MTWNKTMFNKGLIRLKNIGVFVHKVSHCSSITNYKPGREKLKREIEFCVWFFLSHNYAALRQTCQEICRVNLCERT